MNGTTALPPQPYYSSPPPPQRTGLKIYAVLMTIFFFLSLIANVVILMVLVVSMFAGSEGKYQVVTIGGDESASDKIAVIDVYGVVTGESENNEGMVGEVKHRLTEATNDPSVKAVILKIDSPGGEVTASDTLYQEVKKANRVKPVVAHINSVGASGAYYLAMGARHVMATDTSVTASIGVIGQVPNFAGLMNKIGVEVTTFKSGKNKDMMNPFTKGKPEEVEEHRKIMQGLIDEMYEKFLGIVAAARKLDKEELRNGLADGRVMSGPKAMEAKLIDSLGTSDDAFSLAKKLANVKTAQQIKYVKYPTLEDLLSLSLFKGKSAAIQVNVLTQSPQLEAGKLYYLSHHLGY